MNDTNKSPLQKVPEGHLVLNPRLQSGMEINNIEVTEGRLVAIEFENFHFLKRIHMFHS